MDEARQRRLHDSKGILQLGTANHADDVARRQHDEQRTRHENEDETRRSHRRSRNEGRVAVDLADDEVALEHENDLADEGSSVRHERRGERRHGGDQRSPADALVLMACRPAPWHRCVCSGSRTRS